MKPLIFWTWKYDDAPINGSIDGNVNRPQLIIETGAVTYAHASATLLTPWMGTTIDKPPLL
jgi:hypothetical protein